MSKKRALIIDDEPDIRELLEITLGRMNLETVAAANLSDAMNALKQQEFDLCLTDMHLPDGNGLDIINHITQHQPELPVAMITAFGSMDTAITALKAGAFDYVQKPIDLDQLRNLVDTALRMAEAPSESSSHGPKLLGSSQAMMALRAQLGKLARSQAPIYISGESGSGKEVAARQIHALGPRTDGPFVPVNCGAIPTELMESEFFGHVKGSFTGAVADKEGLFQAANQGTLFLDEVADLPLSMQVKLLRAIQEKAVRPIGAQSEDTSDIRILSATHKDLSAEVAAGRFRQDLYYRLNVIELRIPPLREHPEDLEELCNNALQRLASEYGGQMPSLSQEAIQALSSYSFPGNVRELENILERAFTLCENNVIQNDDLQLRLDSQDMQTPIASIPTETPEESIQAGEPSLENDPQNSGLTHQLPAGKNLESYLEDIERDIITSTLEATRWNKTAAAKSLGITFRALRYKLKKLELE